MSKKRGLSLENKRDVILSIYHDNKVPFNLKEIESIGSRMGVVQQTIKDVNQSLVDDSLVYSDKIGSANFFWSFPSKQYEDLNRQVGNLEVSFQRESQINDQLRAEIDAIKKSQSDPSRPSKIRRLSDLKSQEAQIDQELQSSCSFDPAELAKIQAQSKINEQSANRWTDNIWIIKKYLTKKRGMAGKEADKFLKIPAGFDYVSV